MTDQLRPVTRDQQFYAAIAERLTEQSGLLAEIRDRLPIAERGEPAPAGGTSGEPPQVELTEPASSADTSDDPVLTEPAAPKKRPPAKRASAKTTTARGKGRTTAPKKET